MSYEKNLVEGLVKDLLEVIEKYNETMMVSTVIGCLEVVKQQLIEESREGGEEDE